MEDKKDDSALFEIKDRTYIIDKLSELILGILGIIWIFNYLDDFDKSYRYSPYLFVILGIVGIVTSIVSILLKKDKKIVFYKNGIKNSRTGAFIDLSDKKEVYKVISFLSFYNHRTIVKKLNFFNFLLLIVLFPLTILLITLLYMANLIYHRKSIHHNYRLAVIGKVEKEGILIDYSLNNEEVIKVEEYFKEYLNIDVKNMETTWFYKLPKEK